MILTEHVKKTKSSLPKYEVEMIDGKFICFVTVFDELYKSRCGEHSMKDAKEAAAREACKALQLTQTTAANLPR